MNSKKNNLFNFDKALNVKFVIGTDEAGRGPAAGGVFASAVYINNPDIEKELSKLNDSKKLSAKTREELFDIIAKNTINSVVCVEVDEIEKYNILNCSLKAMKLSCESVINQIANFEKDKSLTVVDGNKLIKNYKYSQQYIIKGDSKSASIASASILAKVTRDRYMLKLHEEFPQYDWENNAGYLTPKHQEAILKYGVTKYHRKSFLKKLLNQSKQLSLLD